MKKMTFSFLIYIYKKSHKVKKKKSTVSFPISRKILFACHVEENTSMHSLTQG
jgi:hypothetical protein